MGNLEGLPFSACPAIIARNGTVDHDGDSYVYIFTIFPPDPHLSLEMVVNVRSIKINGVCEVYFKHPQTDVAALTYSGFKLLRPN